MAGEVRGVARRRVTPTLVAVCLIQLAAAAVFLANADTARTPVLFVWLPAIVAMVVASLSAVQAGRLPQLPRATRRLWYQLAVVASLGVLGTFFEAVFAVNHPDSKGGPGPQSGWAQAAYLGTTAVLLWALLPLPMNSGIQREGTTRFALDAATVAVSVAMFVWYVGIRHSDMTVANAAPVLATTVLALLASLAFVKVAMSDVAGMDQITIRLLAGSAAVGSVGGALFPLLVHLRPGLTGTQLFTPVSALFCAFAADRARRAVGVTRAPRRRGTFSRMPYLAVGASDALLIYIGFRAGQAALAVTVGVVVLTVLVVVRQIHALRQNGRLLAVGEAQVQQLERYQEQLTHKATHDDLTDLANRTLFEQVTRAGLAGIGTGPLSLALIDLDDFKAINDRLGHAVGDALLVVIARRIRESVRTDDVVARLGGDEFGLLLHGLCSDEATDVLARITAALARPVRALGHDLLVKASIGLAEAWPGATPQELLRRADVAMYAAKERGKGRHAVYDHELEQHQAADAQLAGELRRALDRGELTLVYQPIVRLPDGAWKGVETLIRWRHADRGFVSPDIFIPIAERTGLIVPLGDWILRTALCQAADWDRTYGPDAPREISVNVSARQLREPGFAGSVRAALAASGFDPERLVVEVTETAVFGGGVALEALNDLVRMGTRVALDDFGTGHSSLGLLRTVPADVLKVDKSFVDGIGGSSEEAVIATALIRITEGLHMDAVAEGVETPEQAETLYRLGYRLAQGYHFARPMPAAEIAERLDLARAALPA